MPVSINALFNVPTRAEKESKRHQAQGRVDRLLEMERADELTRGQLRFAKELGIEFSSKEADALTKRNIAALKTAGEDEATAVKKEAQARVSPIYEGANKAVKWATGGLLGLPKKEAESEVARADASTAGFRNLAAREEGASGLSGELGRISATRDLSGAKLAETQNIHGIDSAPDVASTEAAIREQTRAAAADYAAKGQLRQMTVDGDIMRAQLAKQYMNGIGGDPRRLEMLANPNIQPRDFGLGIGPFGGTPMAPLGQEQQQPGTGMLGIPMQETPEQQRQRMMKSFQQFKSGSAGVRLQE